MEPNYKEGQVVWVLHWVQPEVGDVVVFKFGNKDLVKRVVKIEADWVEVAGDNQADSLEVGRIQTKDVVGKVLR